MIIEKDEFHLKEDILLQMEVLDDAWRIKKSYNYQLFCGKAAYKGAFLQNRDMLVLENGEDERVFLIVRETGSIFHSYTKYDLQGINYITIGKSPDSVIVHDNMNLVSKEHASIVR